MLKYAEISFVNRLAMTYRRTGFHPSTKPLPSERRLPSERPRPEGKAIIGKAWGPDDWRRELGLREDGRPGFEPSGANALAMLRYHPSLSGLIAHDGKKAIMKARAPYDPWAPDFEMRPVNREDITAIHAFIETEALGRIDRKLVIAAVLRAAHENPLEGEV
jgi:hypothetical protein